MGLKSFDQHKESLRDGREVYFDGERGSTTRWRRTCSNAAN